MGRCNECGKEGVGSGTCQNCITNASIARNNQEMLGNAQKTFDSVHSGGKGGGHVLYGHRYPENCLGFVHLVHDVLCLPLHIGRIICGLAFRLFAGITYFASGKTSCIKPDNEQNPFATKHYCSPQWAYTAYADQPDV